MEIKLILELVPLYQLMLVNAEEKKMNRLSEHSSSGYLCMIYSAQLSLITPRIPSAQLQVSQGSSFGSGLGASPPAVLSQTHLFPVLTHHSLSPLQSPASCFASVTGQGLK